MVKTVIQIVEVWIALTVWVLVVWLLVNVIDNWGFFDNFRALVSPFRTLFGWYTYFIFQAFLISIIVMIARRFISLISNNGWERPN